MKDENETRRKAGIDCGIDDNDDSDIIEADIIDCGGIRVSPSPASPVSVDEKHPPPADDKDKKLLAAEKSGFILSPFSGALILFLDYAFFVVGVATLSIPVACALAFVISGTGVFLIQRYISDEPAGKSLAKAFFSAVITGIPTPVFGTIFGSLILTVSGLNFVGRLLNRGKS